MTQAEVLIAQQLGHLHHSWKLRFSSSTGPTLYPLEQAVHLFEVYSKVLSRVSSEIFTKFSHFAFSRKKSRENLFREILLHLFSRKNAKFREKVCKMRTKIFAFFRETFLSLETLVLREGGLEGFHEIIIKVERV